MPLLRQAQRYRSPDLCGEVELHCVLDEPHRRAVVGGMISSTVLTLAVIPAIYALVKQWRLEQGLESSTPTRASSQEKWGRITGRAADMCSDPAFLSATFRGTVVESEPR